MFRLSLAACAAALCIVSAGLAATGAGAYLAVSAATEAHFVPVTFVASDGTRLRGESIGVGAVAIVIAHDADAGFVEWEPGARFLSSHGYRVLLFDYAMNPFLSQTGRHKPGTFRYDRDIAGAVAYLHRTGTKTIVLAGDGVGGLTAIVTAGELGRSIAGTFVLTAGGITGHTDTLGDPSNPDDLNALPAARSMKTPLLVLAARSDTNADPLYRAAGTTSKRRVTLPDSALARNGFGLAIWTSNATWARAARAEVLRFLPKP